MKSCLKMIKIATYLLLLFIMTSVAYTQVENVAVNNPVYSFLLRLESKGLLPHYTLSNLPLSKQKILDALSLARKNESLLSENEKLTLVKFEKDFAIETQRAVLFYSDSDTLQAASMRFFDDYEKLFYHEQDAQNNVSILPLASVEAVSEKNENISFFDKNLLMGTLGFRLNGTLSNCFGYYLQITNTAMLKGDTSLALIDNKFAHNKKLTRLHSDADISESHLAFQKGWFYGSIGRQTRLAGAGLNQRLIINDVSPASDAITLSAKFSNFEYTFSHNSVMAFPTSQNDIGASVVIPSKYIALHNFTILPEWGEITFFESLVYSRDLDLAYLNPFSFFKNLEHSGRDRDNSGMGISFVYRPVSDLQFKGTWFLDDIRLSEIGKGYWSNKTAWNIAAVTSIIKNLDVGLEYSRVEPYTFSHYNSQNSYTNDSLLFGSNILPNSDRLNLMLQYWYGEKYPLQVNFYYTRHGNNIYDEDGNLLRNVGGDPLQTLRWSDELKDDTVVTFLDGDIQKTFDIELSTGYELFRQFSIHFKYNLKYQKDAVRDDIKHYFRVSLILSDF